MSSSVIPPGALASSLPLPRNRNVELKRRLFFEALEAGCTKREASRRAGCTPTTGCKWAKEREAKASDMPSKDAIVTDLFREYLKADTPYKANLAKRIFEAMGFAMRAQADDTQRNATKPLRELVRAWWAEENPHVSADISPMKIGADAHSATRNSEVADAGAQRDDVTPGSPQANADGGDRTDSPTATSSQKVSDPAQQISGKVE